MIWEQKRKIPSLPATTCSHAIRYLSRVIFNTCGSNLRNLIRTQLCISASWHVKADNVARLPSDSVHNLETTILIKWAGRFNCINLKNKFLEITRPKWPSINLNKHTHIFTLEQNANGTVYSVKF